MISLRSKITKKILNYFFLNDHQKFYVNEIAKIIDEDPMNVYRKLIEFKKIGIFSDEFEGKQRYFFINKKYPLLKAYKNIILKSLGFEKILSDNLKKLDGVKSAYIFGSYAKNKFSAGSDIDLLVIGCFNTLDLQKVIIKIQKLTGREINSVELTELEFKKRLKNKDPFLKDILSKEHIKIV